MRAFRTPVRLAALTAIVIGFARPARAAGGESGELMPVLLALVLILVGARLGGALFERFGQSGVLGELMVGVIIGNLGLLGLHQFDLLRENPGIDLLAQIGVIFLLFEVGLESDIPKMVAVGRSALLVAVLGVVAPMVLGFFTSRWFFPDHNPLTHWFVGATLCATSVGITARVLGDLGRTTSKEGRIILGAAVIDDVLGLIVLAVVAGVITAADRGQPFDPLSVVWIVAKSLAFLIGAIVIGRRVSRRTFQLAARIPGQGLLLTLALAFCFALAWLAGLVGLAPIVGAFAAGLILDEVHYHDLRTRDREQRDVPQLLHPIASFLVPVFFVLMGMRVDLTVFGGTGVLLFAGVLTVAAVIGKQACSLGVLERGTDRLAIGFGMIPRGEVGLIFAGVGSTLTIGGVRVVDSAVFSAVVIMVVITTLMTPPLLSWRLRKTAPP